MAPLTPAAPFGMVESKSEPESGDEVVTPWSFPVEPDNDAAGVGRFFLSLKIYHFNLFQLLEYYFSKLFINICIVFLILLL